MEDNKIFFSPGDLCTLKLDIPNKPIMMVIRIERSLIRPHNNENKLLKGLRCRWFTKDGFLLEATFSTKDLIKL